MRITTSLFDKQKVIFYIFGILLFSSILSVVSLFSQSVRLDEAQSIWVATKPVGALLEFTGKDVHVPLYFLLLHFWLQIFGADITAARVLSLLFFMATLPVLFKVYEEASDKKTALISIAFFSLSPFIIWFTSEARMYTLFTFVTSLNHLYFLRVLRSNGKTSKVEYVLSTIVGFYTHYFFFFLTLTQIFFVLLQYIERVYKDTHGYGETSLKEEIKKHIQFPLQYSLLLITAGIFFFPWVLYIFSLGAASNTQPFIPPPTSFNIFQTFVLFLFGFQSFGLQAVFISLWPLTVIALFFIFTQKRIQQSSDIKYFVLVAFLPIALVFLASYFRPIFLSRYLIFTTPAFFFVIAWFVTNFPQKISKYIIVSLLAIMVGLLLYQNISANTPVKEDYQGVAAYLSKHANPQDIIAVSAPFTIYPIEYSYTGTARIETIPEWKRFQQGGTIQPFSKERLQQQIDTYKTRYTHIYLVLSYDQGYERDIRRYFDNNYELTDNQKFSPELELRVYRLRYDTPDQRTNYAS